jgi:transketolase
MELEKILSITPQQRKPMAVIAHTIRGYGSPTMMANDIWFHKAPTDEELTMLVKEVDLF